MAVGNADTWLSNKLSCISEHTGRSTQDNPMKIKATTAYQWGASQALLGRMTYDSCRLSTVECLCTVEGRISSLAVECVKRISSSVECRMIAVECVKPFDVRNHQLLESWSKKSPA
ncbi:hypothetical protein DPMN_057456 [Dreissena polymorpha]|uniref:Uncharacterized protein n=1 Tax=Dreissena polymorpha TaxID=45954 RepID=A0A9D4C087_DREPO|nr:hypothetical protein DPMN_057456 [Dreissena polymorpha]